MDLKERAIKVRVFLLDVDGVLTDGRLYYTSKGEEVKVFNVRDGLGIKLAQKAGIRVGVISGRKSRALLRRLKELEIEEVYLGYIQKLQAFESILKKFSVRPEEVAYMGDDYVDLPVLRRVGFPVSVCDAPQEVKRHALYVTQARGGEGAVREAVEFLLRLRGQWEEVMAEYYA